LLAGSQEEERVEVTFEVGTEDAWDKVRHEEWY